MNTATLSLEYEGKFGHHLQGYTRSDGKLAVLKPEYPGSSLAVASPIIIYHFLSSSVFYINKIYLFLFNYLNLKLCSYQF